MRTNSAHRHRVTGFCALTLCIVTAHAAAPTSIDADRLNASMLTMQKFGGKPNGGSARVAYSQHNKDALDYLADLMRKAGLKPEIDFAGNLIGRRSGRDSTRKPMVSGSHIDTVPNGGHYDGVVGTMAAIEVARTLHDAGHELAHPLEIVVWSNEEGGKTGSRAWNGSVAAFELDLPSLGDKTLREGIGFLGGDPARLHELRREPKSLAAYLELHIEQGAVLNRAGTDIGVVTGIVGIKRWNVTVDGFANHAGTTPMDQRRDALYSAASMVTAVRDIIRAAPGRQVGTVGRIHAEPGAPNVVPGRTTFSLEIRDVDMHKIDRLYERIVERAQNIAAATETRVGFAQFYESPAALTNARIQTAIASSANDLGLSANSMPSGAGHDAQSLAPLGPIGMIFVPSVDGVSHAPSETTPPEDIAKGANVLLRTLLKLDSAAP